MTEGYFVSLQFCSKKPRTGIMFAIPDGNLATTDAENASFLAPHFERVYTNHRPVHWPALEYIAPRETVEGINQPIDREGKKSL